MEREIGVPKIPGRSTFATVSRISDFIMTPCLDQILLQTQRLVLRQFRPEDAPLLFELDSDPEVMRFITKGQPTPLSQIENEILPRILSDYSRVPPQGVWAAHLSSTGEFIGWFHLRADKLEPQEMELGYRLKRTAWGRGLATEGSRALLHKGFNDWQFKKICARTLLANVASQRVMQKIGLRFETAFAYPVAMMPDWTADERRAVKYSLTREKYTPLDPVYGSAREA
jgi:RimJ/RimL family protein N-acetyltransferase